MRPGDGHPASLKPVVLSYQQMPLERSNLPCQNYALFPFSSRLEEGGITSGF